jgi:transcription elongation factor GreA
MNKEAVDLLIAKTPRLKKSRAILEAMEPGTYCVHRSWGLGQITDYNAAENRLIIDFKDGNKGHSMDPTFCVDKLTILDADDILVRAQHDQAEVDDLVKNRPADLIVELLEKAPGKAATALDIETTLTRLMGPAKFKKWWTQTKKALVRDERIAVPAKRTEPYILRDEPVKAEDEILEEFFETKAPKKKINFASKLIELSVKHEDIKEKLPRILEELAVSLAETRQLNAGERLYGIWVRNDLARFIHSDVETLEPTSASIILSTQELIKLTEDIPATHFGRFLDLVKRTLPEQWVRITFDLLKNSSGKLTSECINFLIEHERGNEITQTFERWLVEQNLKAPVLAWILKNRATKRYQNMLKPLLTPRLIGAIFFAIDYEALQNNSSRRIPLAELVNDDQSLIAELMQGATHETAHDLAQTLILNQGFEDLSKKSLLARFIRLYPDLQDILSGDGHRGPSAKPAETSELVVSKWSFDQRKKEYDLLINERIPRNKEEVAEARAHGDLRENAEYKMARQEQELLLAQKNELETTINKARVTDFSDARTDVVSVGSVVTLTQASTGSTAKYSILGAWDGNPDENILSYQTPLAKALLGKAAGEQVAINVDDNAETWSIDAIARWVDLNPSKG